MSRPSGSGTSGTSSRSARRIRKKWRTGANPRPSRSVRWPISDSSACARSRTSPSGSSSGIRSAIARDVALVQGAADAAPAQLGMDVAPQVVVRDAVADDPFDHRERDEVVAALDEHDVRLRHQAVGALVLGPHLLFGRHPWDAVVEVGDGHQRRHRAVVGRVTEGVGWSGRGRPAGPRRSVGGSGGYGHHGDSSRVEATVASGRGLRQSVELFGDLEALGEVEAHRLVRVGAVHVQARPTSCPRSRSDDEAPGDQRLGQAATTPASARSRRSGARRARGRGRRSPRRRSGSRCRPRPRRRRTR